MKYNNSKFYILNAILFLAILISFSLTAPDYSIGLRRFLQNEDSRDLDKVLNSYSFPVKNYWNQKNVSRYDLEKSYKKAWEKVEYSRNYLLETKRLDNFNFILTTQFVYKLKNRSYTSTVRSKLNVKLNNDGKIVSIENIELLKSSGKALIKNIENEEAQTFNAFVRTSRYTLVFVFFIIVLNVWWFISYRDFETKRKKQELIEEEKARLARIEEEKERLAKIEEEERQWLIQTIKIDTIEDEKDAEILKLIERLKALNSGVESNYTVYKKAELIELIKEKHLSNINQEKERLARIERERLAEIEKEKTEKARQAKIKAEQKKEERRLFKIQREKELKTREKIRLQKEKLEKQRQEKERQEKEKLALIEEQQEKERLEAAERNKLKKSPSMDLGQYMGSIDENILKDEKSKSNQNENLRKYLRDFDDKKKKL